MRAAVIDHDKVTVESVPDPQPAPGEVVLAVAGCGICGTDLHIADGEFAPTLPVVPGHEFAGEVVALGAEVRGFRIGDQVAVDPSLYCHECYFCRRGRGNQCERWGGIGVTVAGAAAEYVAAPVANCVHLPAGVAPADAALIEPLSCAVHGFDVLAPAVGDHYLIYGAGTMGLMMMELAKRAGAASVSMVDINPQRLQTAHELGCTAAVTGADELEQGRGWDNVIDCTGALAAIEDGLPRVIAGGTYQQFGVAAEQASARFSPNDVYRREIRIVGSMSVLRSYERAAEMFAQGLLRPDVMISDRLPLEEYPAALEQFRAGTGRKIQIRP